MSIRFTAIPTPLDGALVLERHALSDGRGFLERLWCDGELAKWCGGKPIRQITRTRTRQRGAIRGLHFQRPPHADVKFVHCLRGAVFDVGVDLRARSPTFGQWHAVELSEDNSRTYVLPEGFAHGFQALSEDCEMLYFHTAPHAPAAEDGIAPDDPVLSIEWPLPITAISERDRTLPVLSHDFESL